MAIDIAAMTAPQKLAFAQAVGSVKLAGEEVVAAAHEIVIPLADGYWKYDRSLTNATTSPSD